MWRAQVRSQGLGRAPSSGLHRHHLAVPHCRGTGKRLCCPRATSCTSCPRDCSDLAGQLWCGMSGAAAREKASSAPPLCSGWPLAAASAPGQGPWSCAGASQGLCLGWAACGVGSQGSLCFCQGTSVCWELKNAEVLEAGQSGAGVLGQVLQGCQEQCWAGSTPAGPGLPAQSSLAASLIPPNALSALQREMGTAWGRRAVTGKVQLLCTASGQHRGARSWGC